MKCKDCKFWRPLDGFAGTTGVGECHRRAPSSMPESAAVVIGLLRTHGRLDPAEEDRCTVADWTARQTLWPTTHEAEFCGEFAPANQATFV
jgi:hypothetical protein